MTKNASSYNLAIVHDLLTTAFGAEELHRFCQRHPIFEPVLANFGPNYNLNQMADEVVEYCRTHLLWDELLAAVKETNPRQYERFRDRLGIPDSPTHTPSSPPVPCEPAARKETPTLKDLLSKPIVWLVLGALVIFAGYLLFIHRRPPPVARVALTTAHNRYVTAMGADWDWVLRAETAVIGDYEEFTLICRDNGKAALQTYHKTEEGKNRYVTAMGADHDWVLKAETDLIDDWEKFTLLDADSGERQPCLEVVEALKDDGKARIAFQTWHKKEGKNRLVTAMVADWDWVLRAETNELRGNERFTVILLP